MVAPLAPPPLLLPFDFRWLGEDIVDHGIVALLVPVILTTGTLHQLVVLERLGRGADFTDHVVLLPGGMLVCPFFAFDGIVVDVPELFLFLVLGGVRRC